MAIRLLTAKGAQLALTLGLLTCGMGKMARTDAQTPPAAALPTPPAPPATAAPGGSGAVASADKSTITIESTKTIELCDCNGRRITLPVTIKPGKSRVLAADEQPAITEVLRGTSRVLSNDFTLTWSHAKRKPTALTLAVSDALRTPGNYKLQISLFPKSNPEEPRDNLQVTLPAATIDPSERIEILRTVYWPWEPQSVKETSTPLLVREAGRLADISTLAGQSALLISGVHVVDGTVKALPGHVPRDRTIKLPYVLEGKFPLGITTGTLLLHAKELQQPSKVAVEIHSRLAARYLVATIIIALIMSWLLKVTLTRHIQLLRVRALAQRLLGMIAVDRARFQELEFSDAIDRSQGDLQALLRDSRTAEDIDAARTRLDAEWRAAVQAAEARRAEFRTRARAFSDAVTLDWKLPQGLRQPLADARTNAAAMVASPITDIRTSLTALQKAQQALGEAIQRGGAQWQQDSRDGLQRVVDTGRGLPEALTTAVAEELATFKERFPIPGQQPQRFDTASVETILRSVAGQYLVVRDLISVAGKRLDRTLQDVLDQIEGANEAALARVMSGVEQVKQLLALVADDPTESEKVVGVLRDLQRAWEEELVALASAETTDRVRQLAVARQFEEAAANLAPHAGAAFAPLAADTSSASAPGGLFSAPVLPAPTTVLPFPILAAGPGAPFVALMQSSMRSLAFAKGLQTLALGGLFVLSTLVTELAKWDGTWRGLAMIFFAVAALDLTADTLITRLSSRE
jgi:hypothetical protein